MARRMLLGDIILAHGVCAAEAAEKGVSVDEHATHLVVHGTLHLLGYDHQADADAATWKRAKSARSPGSASPIPMRWTPDGDATGRRRRLAAVARHARI